jgi:hypothetical protein
MAKIRIHSGTGEMLKEENILDRKTKQRVFIQNPVRHRLKNQRIVKVLIEPGDQVGHHQANHLIIKRVLTEPGAN